MKLSVLIITKNAEEIIREALKSAEGLWDELVIVDNGSNDGTVKLVRKFTNKVFVNLSHNNFSEIKNYGLSKISGDWVLSLDADERLSKEMRERIPTLIKNRNIGGYWFRRKTFIVPNRYLHYGLFYPDWQLRLFRNKKEYRYRGAVHEQLTIPKEKTKEVSYDILHFPQHPKYTSFTDFYNLMPYVRIHVDELEKASKSIVTLLFDGIGQFTKLFFGGFFRGKGFLDGWEGFRAHIIFASSIALAYTIAAWKRTKRT